MLALIELLVIHESFMHSGTTCLAKANITMIGYFQYSVRKKVL
jgi:hypothetical protein